METKIATEGRGDDGVESREGCSSRRSSIKINLLLYLLPNNSAPSTNYFVTPNHTKHSEQRRPSSAASHRVLLRLTQTRYCTTGRHHRTKKNDSLGHENPERSSPARQHQWWRLPQPQTVSATDGPPKSSTEPPSPALRPLLRKWRVKFVSSNN